MSGFDYKQRATTPEYRDNWDRIFGTEFDIPRAEVSKPYTSTDGPGRPTPVVERPGQYLSPLDGDTGRDF